MFEGQIERQMQRQLKPYEERVAKLEKHLVVLRGQVKHLTAALQEMQEQQEQKSTTERDTADPLGPQTDVELQRVQPHQMGTSSSSASRVCYLLTPSSDGCLDSAPPTEQIGKNIYRLSTTDGVNSTFIVLSSPDTITTAMISVSQFVKPTCKIVDNANVYPHSIGTIDEGLTVFENEIQRAVSKAVVKFDQ